MDRTTQSVIKALKEEQQQLLEALGDFPKPQPFDHGIQVGTYHGIKKALEVINSVLEENTRRDADL